MISIGGMVVMIMTTVIMPNFAGMVMTVGDDGRHDPLLCKDLL